ERFLPVGLASIAYSDEALAVAKGREILPPRVLAKLIQLAGLEAEDNVLVISEAGYAAAVVAQIVAKVVALLADDDGANVAKAAFHATGASNVIAVAGSAVAGWQANAPYDVILIEGGIEQVPEGLKGQLREGGRLVAIGTTDGLGRAVAFHKR